MHPRPSRACSCAAHRSRPHAHVQGHDAAAVPRARTCRRSCGSPRRYLQAGTLLVAPGLHRPPRARARGHGASLARSTGALLAAILWLRRVPGGVRRGQRVSPPFKNGERVRHHRRHGASALALLLARRDAFEPRVLAMLAASIVAAHARRGRVHDVRQRVRARRTSSGTCCAWSRPTALPRDHRRPRITRPYDLLFRELKQSEAALRESEERFRTTFEEARVGIGSSGLDEPPASRSTTGSCEIAGRRARSWRARRRGAHPPRRLPRAEQPLHRRAARGESGPPTRVEKRYVLPDGSLRWVSTTRSLLRDDDGEPRYFIVRRGGHPGAPRRRGAAAPREAAVRRAQRHRRGDELVARRRTIMRDASSTAAPRRWASRRSSVALREGGGWSSATARGFRRASRGRTPARTTTCPLHVVVGAARAVRSSCRTFADGARRVRARMASFAASRRTSACRCVQGRGRRACWASRSCEAPRPSRPSRSTSPRAWPPRCRSRSRTRGCTRSSTGSPTRCRRRCSRRPRTCPASSSRTSTAPPPRRRASAATSTTCSRSAPDVVGIIVGDVSGKGIEAAALTAIVKTAIKAHAMQRAARRPR